MSGKSRWLIMCVLAALLLCGRQSTNITAATYAGTPYSGTAAAIPGTIQAENFDNGGEGVAYHDTDAGNNGGVYRSTNVDIGAGTQAPYAIGWTDPGEWLNYTVRVASTGTYNVTLRVASPVGGGVVHVGFNGATSVWNPVTMPATGDWGAYTTVSFRAQIAAGTQQMTLYFDTGGMNVDSIAVSAVSTTSSSTPYSGTAVSLPGTLHASDFDNGGEGVAYHDTGSGNNGGVYRSTDVDLEGSSEGGYNVGWISAGEWLNYSVSVGAAGSYNLQLRVASLAGGTMHVQFSGNAANVAVAVPATGGWQNWTSVTVPAVLSAGAQTLTFYFDTGGYNLNTMVVSTATSSGGGTGGGGTGGTGGGTGSTPPAVTLTAPSSSASFTAPAAITVSANASTTSGTITKVDFYAGSTLIASDTTSPYSVSWSGVAAGTYSLTAKATSSAGLATTSSAMSVTVSAASTGGGGTGGSGGGAPPPGGAVLDNFSEGNRNVPLVGSLWTHYQEGASGSVSVVSSALQETVGGVTNSSGGGTYLQFVPKTNDSYAFPGGYAQAYVTSGSWNSGYNRLTFRVKTSVAMGKPSSGGPNIEFGTYIRAHNNTDPNFQGAHYYHQLGIDFPANRWVYITINCVPQHQVGDNGTTNYGCNPTGDGYFDDLTRFYFDAIYGGGANATWTYDDFQFSQASGEPDTLVASVSAQYDGSKYKLSWATPKNQSVSYTVYYSTVSMHANGLSAGTSGGTTSSTGNTYVDGPNWQSAGMAQPAGGMYFAIQPSGSSSFTEIYVPAN